MQPLIILKWLTFKTYALTILVLLLAIANPVVFAQEKTPSPASQSFDETNKESAETTTSAPNKEENANQEIVKKTQAEPPLPIATSAQHKADLTHYLPENNVKSILAGPDDYITLISENMSINNKGVAILLPDWQQSATNPKAINLLRNELPLQGWTTISIQPLNKPDSYPSRALTLNEQQEENTKIIDEYQVKLGTMINAVIDKASDYPGIVIIIAQGNHGAMLVHLLSEKNEQIPITKQPNGVILLSSYVLTSNALLDDSNTAFAKQLAYSEYPVLDLLLRYDNPIVLDKAKQRMALSKKEMKVYYRQRQLNNNNVGYYPKQELLTQINSWLKSIGW